ncbi:sulfite exporter TauE/SafE family protein [Neomoorella thermoacetica]|uniref:Probable membrane transporter protein n=1 Tax=Moorella thermoacetica Y72 TaxID=1325331 RepID=A0A0S6UCR5_NEOTH|nr:sulfite exporter TauE/SafE family protein [Moorella thermoacetica]OIQ52744.1 sulfite exporter TauE/SafE [Moorella thermoacetica]GAF26068.1 predicted permeases [Moorella thermoacetica Y72]
MAWSLTMEILIMGFLTGILGAMVGIGGGVLLVPFLTLVFHVPIHTAIGASIVAVIATSSTSASTYLESRLTNLRLGMTLETATATGGILGGLTAALLSRQVLSGIFAVALVGTAYSMLKKVKAGQPREEVEDTGRLGSTFYDANLKREVRYNVKRLPLGLFISFIAGNISGLLGIGGGVIKVPMMVLGMGVPMRAAAATSNFMIGVTAVASAYIYYTRGFVDPLIAAPTAIGVFLGAMLSSRLAGRVNSNFLAKLLAVVLIFLAVQMALSAAGIQVR